MAVHLLWDVDGTLVENDFTTVSIYALAFEATTGVPPTVPIANPHGMTEGQLTRELLRLHGHDELRHEEMLGHLDVIAAQQHSVGVVRVPCAGVEAALRRFAELGWSNGLLTGNARERARLKLVQAGIDTGLVDWDRSFFGDRSATRHDLTADARAALGDGTVVVIGDTPNDGAAAASAGFAFLGVGTGSFAATELRDVGAFCAIESFAVGLDTAIDAVRALDDRPGGVSAADA